MIMVIGEEQPIEEILHAYWGAYACAAEGYGKRFAFLGAIWRSGSSLKATISVLWTRMLFFSGCLIHLELDIYIQ